jgi:hypothetical protein
MEMDVARYRGMMLSAKNSMPSLWGASMNQSMKWRIPSAR